MADFYDFFSVEDMERNEGREYYMSKELAKIVGVYTGKTAEVDQE